jgi:hypothetical protein
MKQARFEQQYRPLWDSLEQQLEELEALRVSRKKRLPLDRFVADYRQLCHQRRWPVSAPTAWNCSNT